MALQLTTDTLAQGVAELARRDPHLAAVVARHGAPPLWDRPPGFETLVQIILEQQISLSAGRAAYGRLERLAGAVTPERVAALTESDLRSAGLTDFDILDLVHVVAIFAWATRVLQTLGSSAVIKPFTQTEEP